MQKKITFLAALLLLNIVTLEAQSFQQALFLDGYRLGYRYNPALQNQDAFLSIGQLESQSRNNYGAASFLYPRGNEVVTALHSSVSAEEFLGSLCDLNQNDAAINYNLVAYGWRRGNAYHTLEANVRGQYAIGIPKEIFAIAKLGSGETLHDLSGFNVAGSALVELAYGYSHKVSDILSLGARAKLLLGIDALNYRITRMDLYMSGDKYQLDLEADMDLTSRWSKILADEHGYLNLLNTSLKGSWKLPSGIGLALDLGVVLTPVEGLTLSASILDLGGMLWYYGNAAHSQGTTVFTGVTELSMDDIREGNIKGQFQDDLDGLLKSLRLKEEKSWSALVFAPFHVNLGARYEMPFYRPLSIGATGNFMNVKGFTYAEGRGVLAWNPWKWLGVTANAGAGTFGPVWGVAANVAIKRFRITLGYSDGFGGTVPYTSYQLKPNNKVVTAGLSFDL